MPDPFWNGENLDPSMATSPSLSSTKVLVSGNKAYVSVKSPSRKQRCTQNGITRAECGKGTIYKGMNNIQGINKA